MELERLLLGKLVSTGDGKRDEGKGKSKEDRERQEKKEDIL